MRFFVPARTYLVQECFAAYIASIDFAFAVSINVPSQVTSVCESAAANITDMRPLSRMHHRMFHQLISSEECLPTIAHMIAAALMNPYYVGDQTSPCFEMFVAHFTLLHRLYE